eukprot:364526-Chlamydomonas_euryale.AAC.1
MALVGLAFVAPAHPESIGWARKQHSRQVQQPIVTPRQQDYAQHSPRTCQTFHSSFPRLAPHTRLMPRSTAKPLSVEQQRPPQN